MNRPLPEENPTQSEDGKQSEVHGQSRFGIGEWYGRSFIHLTREERYFYASIQSRKRKPPQPCPFLSAAKPNANCWKPGGVCSLRLYERSTTTGFVRINPAGSSLRTTCPSRFEERGTIYRWIGEVLLGSSKAVPIGEVPFLQRLPKTAGVAPEALREVGRIDNVLVVPDSNPLQWCPVEKQAVYFSGRSMMLDFRHITKLKTAGLPFPTAHRRPDYRSSGPKRLMPQLQVKVPTLSRWGKKMAVVVDEDFFEALGSIDQANDLSNAEVVWFIVHYVELADGTIQLQPSRTFMSTLEESLRGLIAAEPLPRFQFEDMIRAKLQKR